MKYTILLAVFLFGVVSCFSEVEYRAAFTQWSVERQKSYTNDEFLKRYEIFKANMDFVKLWNEDPVHTHTVGLNDFADLSSDEYKSIYLPRTFDASAKLANAGPKINVSKPLDDVINWAAKGAVTPIKNQGQCGSCWAFSTTGSIEGLNFIYTGNLNSLSEQNLMDCSGGYGNQGCNGGNVDDTFQYVIANNGVDLEQDYPYETAQGSCRFQAQWTGATIKSYSDVQSGNEDALCSAANTQPVSVAIDASHQSFQLYTSGIYYEAACSTTQLDHAVLVVGYGSQNGDYFIVKNSWGTGWGMQGYIWMSRNANNNCGIASDPSVPLAQ